MFVGGDEFAEIKDDLWMFAIVGTLLAMLQLLVYSVAGPAPGPGGPIIWTALAVLVAIAVTAVDGATRWSGRRAASTPCCSWRCSRSAGQPALGPARPTRPRRLMRRLVSGLVPAAARPDRDVERHEQVGGRAHLLADQGVERVPLPRRHLEDELVVDLEQHP